MKQTEKTMYQQLVSKEYLRELEKSKKNKIKAKFMGCEIMDEDIYKLYKRKDSLDIFLMCLIWFLNGCMITLAWILNSVQ